LSDTSIHIKISQNPGNLGSTKNFEQALNACSGDVLFPCDQDDIWRKDKIRLCLDAFAFSNADVIFHDAVLVDRMEHPIGRLWKSIGFGTHEIHRFAQAPNQFPFLLRQPVATGCCMAIRRSAFQKALPFGRAWIHDEWIAMSASARGARLFPIADALVNYRQHPVQQVGTEETRLFGKARRMLAAGASAYQNDIQKFGEMKHHLVSQQAPTSAIDILDDRILHAQHRASIGTLRHEIQWLRFWEEIRSGRYNAYSTRIMAPTKDLARIVLSYFPDIFAQ
jgi:hypothetical protein